MEAARAKIEDIQAQYEAGEKTEDAFAALATENTVDPGSKDNGGLYENVREGQMIPAFNDWIFDPARQPGDVDIVEDAQYNGYHLMYFVGEGESTQHVVAREALASSAMTAFDESLTKDFQYESLFAMRYVGPKK